MLDPLFPHDWYWVRDDGSVYSSARQQVVEASNPDYLAWVETHIPTRWPADDDGGQTDAALQEVLTQHELHLSAGSGLRAYAADKRWRVETGGINVGGAPIATDDRSKTMIMGARIKADADPDYTVGWKTEAGFVTLSAAQIVAISDAVLAHVDACFSAEAAVLSDIEDGTITAVAGIDTYAWPS